MLVLVTCFFIMVVILASIAAAASGRKARHTSGKYDGPETNLNIRALFDDSLKKR